VGYAVAEAALENGAKVTISSSNQTRIDAAVESLKASYPSSTSLIRGAVCNVGDRSSLESNVLALLENTGQIDHIVWTAGDSIPPTPITEATVEAIDHAATVRYIAPILLVKHALKHLAISPESSITLTTGVVTEKPIPNWSVIAGARSAVIGLTKNLALDIRPIRVNAVAVGAVDTETWSHLPQEAKEKTFQALVSKSTTGRIAEAGDVAEAYLYCMKDRNVTGSIVSTNGGVLLM
jgi:NAD(P)-dependent dehydrogenase (short-subunit alcohol dehydrogenase family)